MGIMFGKDMVSRRGEEMEELKDPNPEYVVIKKYPLEVAMCSWLTDKYQVGRAIIKDFGSLQQFRENVDSRMVKSGTMMLVYSATSKKIEIIKPTYDDETGIKKYYVDKDRNLYFLTLFMSGTNPLPLQYRNGCQIYHDSCTSWDLVDKRYKYILQTLENRDDKNFTKEMKQMQDQFNMALGKRALQKFEEAKGQLFTASDRNAIV